MTLHSIINKSKPNPKPQKHPLKKTWIKRTYSQRTRLSQSKSLSVPKIRSQKINAPQLKVEEDPYEMIPDSLKYTDNKFGTQTTKVIKLGTLAPNRRPRTIIQNPVRLSVNTRTRQRPPEPSPQRIITTLPQIPPEPIPSKMQNTSKVTLPVPPEHARNLERIENRVQPAPEMRYSPEKRRSSESAEGKKTEIKDDIIKFYGDFKTNQSKRDLQHTDTERNSESRTMQHSSTIMPKSDIERKSSAYKSEAASQSGSPAE